MKTARLRAVPTYHAQLPQTEQDYYRELTTRNQHFVSAKTQENLSRIKVLIAGCGSTGGACIEPLARLGMKHFALADNGAYELNNLNRQHATLGELGKNKAQFHAEQLLKINPYIQPLIHTDGINAQNVEDLTHWADIVIDAIDVTSRSGIESKLLLHAHSQRSRVPVVAGLDLGFRQWGISYDYRNPNVSILNGRYENARKAGHPIKAIFEIVPLSILPWHTLKMVEELLTGESISASQMGCTSDMLSAVIVPVMLRFAETGELIKGWDYNTEALAYSRSKRIRGKIEGIARYLRIKRLLAGLE